MTFELHSPIGKNKGRGIIKRMQPLLFVINRNNLGEILWRKDHLSGFDPGLFPDDEGNSGSTITMNDIMSRCPSLTDLRDEA